MGQDIMPNATIAELDILLRLVREKCAKLRKEMQETQTHQTSLHPADSYQKSLRSSMYNCSKWLGLYRRAEYQLEQELLRDAFAVAGIDEEEIEEIENE